MKNIVINKKELKETVIKLLNNGVIRILLLIALVLAAAVIFSTKNRLEKKNIFGKLVYQESSIETEPVPPATKVDFAFQNDNFPKEVRVYPIDQPGEEKLVSLFNKLTDKTMGPSQPKIISDPISKTYYKDVGNSVFVGNLINGGFSFSGMAKIHFTESPEKELVSNIFSFLRENGLERNLTGSAEISYLTTAGDEIVTTASSSATILSLTYPPQINGLPLVGVGAANNLVNFLIEKASGTILKIQYYNPKVNTEQGGVYELLTINDVKKMPPSSFRILKIVAEQQGGFIDLDLSRLASISFNKVGLSYLFSSQKHSLLLPVYVLEGKATSVTGKSGKISVYVPAVKNSSLNPAP